MGITVTRREYDPSKGNIFEWIVEEVERLRYWSGEDLDLPVSRRAVRKLDKMNHHAAPFLHQPQEPSPHSAIEDIFKVPHGGELGIDEAI